mmetsp:Transcript_12070/g.18490  ORF Transcript_12070/g.18490 Transcript_12070/m.18490 type:complete len:129 (+) Transcript_12070:548-934(+)
MHTLGPPKIVRRPSVGSDGTRKCAEWAEQSTLVQSAECASQCTVSVWVVWVRALRGAMGHLFGVRFVECAVCTAECVVCSATCGLQIAKPVPLLQRSTVRIGTCSTEGLRFVPWFCGGTNNQWEGFLL